MPFHKFSKDCSQLWGGNLGKMEMTSFGMCHSVSFVDPGFTTKGLASEITKDNISDSERCCWCTFESNCFEVFKSNCEMSSIERWQIEFFGPLPTGCGSDLWAAIGLSSTVFVNALRLYGLPGKCIIFFLMRRPPNLWITEYHAT